MATQSLFAIADGSVFNAWALGGGGGPATKTIAVQTRDGNTSYVNSAVAGTRQAFDVTVLNPDAESISQVDIITNAARGGGTNAPFFMFASMGALTSDGALVTGTGTYQDFTELNVPRPSGGPWLPAEFFAGGTAEFGVAKGVDTNQDRVTYLEVVVTFLPAVGGFQFGISCILPILLGVASHGLQLADLQKICSKMNYRPSHREEYEHLLAAFSRRPAYAFNQ